MATKTSPSRRPAAKRRPAASKRARTKRRPAKRRGPAKTPTRQILSPWARDALGIGLVVLAGLAVLSVWVDMAGPAGRGLAWLLAAGFGVAAVLFPLVGAWWGIVLLRDVAREDRVRMFIGFLVLGAGLLGIVSLLRGNPSVASGYTGGHDAAGLLGAAVAWPLSRVLSTYGAFVVCLGLAVLGLLIFTGTPIATVIERIGELRAERAERDPVGTARVETPEPVAEPRRRRSIREALGFDELPDEEPAPVVVIPDADQVELGYPEDLVEELQAPVEGHRGAGNRGRRVSTPAGDYRLPPIDLLRTAPASTADGRDEEEVMEALERTLVTFGVDARVTGAHRGPDRHDVRGRGRRRHEGEQGAAASRATSRTRSPRRTSASSRRSPASRRSASRCRTSTATS